MQHEWGISQFPVHHFAIHISVRSMPPYLYCFLPAYFAFVKIWLNSFVILPSSSSPSWGIFRLICIMVHEISIELQQLTRCNACELSSSWNWNRAREHNCLIKSGPWPQLGRLVKGHGGCCLAITCRAFKKGMRSSRKVKRFIAHRLITHLRLTPSIIEHRRRLNHRSSQWWNKSMVRVLIEECNSLFHQMISNIK